MIFNRNFNFGQTFVFYEMIFDRNFEFFGQIGSSNLDHLSEKTMNKILHSITLATLRVEFVFLVVRELNFFPVRVL